VLLLAILKGIPPWVWVLLAVLVFFGLKATREREVSSALYWLFPLLGLLAVPKLVSLGRWEAWAAFAAANLLGALAGYSYQGKVILGVRGSRIRVAGEWVTFASMMAIFASNTASGIISAVSPDLITRMAPLILLVSLPAFFGGMFIGRAMRVVRLAAVKGNVVSKERGST